FSAPVNCGNTINTSRDEMTPFYDNLNGQLYFSSEGHVGFGGLDVFKATGEKAVWRERKNLGPPVNGSTDELYFHFDFKRDIGMLVSNRTELNVSGSTCCDDIFFIKYEKPKRLALRGFVNDKDPYRNFPLDDARVSLSFIDESGTSVLLREK